MRTTPAPTIFTPLRVVSGSRWATTAGAVGTSVAGRSPGTVIAMRSTTRSTKVLAPPGSSVCPAPGAVLVRTSRNGRPELRPGDLDVPVAQRREAEVGDRLDDAGVDDRARADGRAVGDDGEVLEAPGQIVRHEGLGAGNRRGEVEQGDAALRHLPASTAVALTATPPVLRRRASARRSQRSVPASPVRRAPDSGRPSSSDRWARGVSRGEGRRSRLLRHRRERAVGGQRGGAPEPAAPVRIS